ncbi:MULTISPECIES: hypothetical protein [Kocuria]|uniref:Uncharacterized protein n=1 Tax=Kocuria subflava TaxID=1736139 RepID=A0A846TVQ4_9MICC|nr:MULTISPECIES: hypothetical protein [Kocuria]NKE09784.1 hypothetical protein [Kocuria subflava]
MAADKKGPQQVPGGSILAQVLGEVRLESETDGFDPPGHVLEATYGGMLQVLRHVSYSVARSHGYPKELPDFQLHYSQQQPGHYLVDLRVVDQRPAWVRMVNPKSAACRERYRVLLRWVAELMSTTVQLVPPITMAEDIKISAAGDQEGFGTLMLDNRRTYRVPLVMMGIFENNPALVDALTGMMSVLLLPEVKALVIVRDPLESKQRDEVVIPLSETFHRKIIHETYHSLAGKVQAQDAPLSSVLTRHERRQDFPTGISGLDPSA